MTDRPRLRDSMVSYSSLMVLARALLMVQGIIVIRLMDPEHLGIWLSLQLIALYGVHMHLGLINAVNRQIPFHIGRGKAARAEHIAGVVRGNLIVGSCFAAVVLLSFCSIEDIHQTTTRGAVLVTAATILNLNVEFYYGLFRARHEFGRAGTANVVNAATTVLGLPLVYYFGLDGLFWRGVAAAALTLMACIALDRGNSRIRFDRRETLSLIRIGLPIMVVSYALVAFSSMDRVLIWRLLSKREMGEYALCFVSAGLVSLLPTLIGQIFYPRMTESYAAQGLSRDVLRLCRSASVVSAILAGLVCAGLRCGLPWLIEAYFPRYVAGLAPWRIALGAYFLLSLSSGPTYFLIATTQKRRQFAILVAAATVMAVAGYAWSSQGLTGIAWAVVLGTFLYVSALWVIFEQSVRQAISCRT